MNTPNHTIYYHAACADGHGAAYAAWTALGDEAEYVPVKYGQINSLDDVDLLGALTDRYVYVLDFSFPREVMEYIFKTAKYTVWLDHHLTAFKMWCPTLSVGLSTKHSELSEQYTIELDNAASGALIAWRYFNGQAPVPLLIKHIDDYDRWVFALPHTKEFSKALWAQAPWSLKQWNELCMTTSDGGAAYHALVATGAALLTEHNNQVKRATAKSRECRIYDAGGLAVNAPPNLTSDSGHALALQSGTYGLIYHIDHELKVKCSLRSTGDYDVSALAKVYGGGGHKNAAGFECSLEVLKSILISNDL